MQDLAPFIVEEFDEAKCFQSMLSQYEARHGAQALEVLQRDLSVSCQELKSRIVSAVRTDFDALARAPLEMLQLDDCVQCIEDKAQHLQNFSATSLDKINAAKSNIQSALEDFRNCQLHRFGADAELQRVMWLHDLGTILSRYDSSSPLDIDHDASGDTASGACLHLCLLAHSVEGLGKNGVSLVDGSNEVDNAAAAAVLAVQALVLPRIKDALRRLHRVPSYIRCLCLIAPRGLVLSTILDSISLPVISRIFSSATSVSGSAAALAQLFVDLEKELCLLLQLLQRPALLLSDHSEIDACEEFLLTPFFARLLKSEYCTDFVQVDTVTDRYFAYMKGLQLLAGSSALSASQNARVFLQQRHESSSATWALPLRALSQVRSLALLLCDIRIQVPPAPNLISFCAESPVPNPICVDPAII